MVESHAPLVMAEDMAKKYGDFVALHPLNVEVHAGEFFGVFGPNGAGKSTFIKLLTGQLRPSKGRIEVLGVNAVTNPQKVKANIGIVPESINPVPTTPSSVIRTDIGKSEFKSWIILLPTIVASMLADNLDGILRIISPAFVSR